MRKQVYEANSACIKRGKFIIGGREWAKHNALSKQCEHFAKFAHEIIQTRNILLVKVDTTKSRGSQMPVS
jgi:hypothetical protein